MYHRNLTPALLDALSDTPVVLLNGPRQSGKSTLARAVANGIHPARYVTLDDATALAAARSSPADFIAGLEGPTVIDEVQRAPDLFLAIKAEVDRDRRPGRFLLTGSADVMMLPALSESLARRIEVLTLWPLSQGEMEGLREGFVDALFGSEPLPAVSGADDERADLLRRAIAGGFPEVVARETPRRRRAWFGSYLTTILQRDVRELANIEGLTDLPRLLALLAARSSSLLNYADVSRGSGIAQSTLKRYMALLEATFLLQPIPAWSSNLSSRVTKSPKLTLCDSGLLAYLLGVNEDPGGTLVGPLVESFTAMELRKQLGWSRVQARIHHFRTAAGQEVDLLLEDSAGRIVGVEVKASATVTAHDFRHLAALAEAAGDRFRRGVVLYAGRESVAFGPRLHALPFSALWRFAEPVSSDS